MEVAPITQRRTFSGTLEATTRVQVAARVTGRISRIAVDLGDHIERGQVIAEIDAAELEQAVLQSAADLAVAKATVTEARASAEFSARTLERLEALDKDGIASASELDAGRAQASARKASVTVAEARVQRAEAALGVAQLQRSEASVLATWSSDDGPTVQGATDSGLGDPAETVRPPSVRAVAERYVDEGELVSAGTPLVMIVGLQPIVAVVFVPERDYAKVQPGAIASLTTDAYPDEAFEGVVSRVAPVFSRTTRQVRVELTVNNEELRLKPGMFVRATLELDRNEAALVIPFAAITRRDGADGVFVLSGPDGLAVRWLPVRQKIREGARVEIEAQPGFPAVSAGNRVVTLGQELCDDGSRVVVPDDAARSKP